MFLGYVQLFVRIESSNRETSYLEFHSDFTKPITRKFFRIFKKAVKKDMCGIGVHATKISFVTKEEYESRDKQNEKTITCTW
ncbi:MAG: hypothetical protein UFG06_13945 [Lachnospiraceae bacterium]|nr:hypothetical protein [Lachnospiraceae bacterium]